MKKCGYCGAESDDLAEECRGCGTAFPLAQKAAPEVESGHPTKKERRPLWIITAVYLLIISLWDLFNAPAYATHGPPRLVVSDSGNLFLFLGLIFQDICFAVSGAALFRWRKWTRVLAAVVMAVFTPQMGFFMSLGMPSGSRTMLEILSLILLAAGWHTLMICCLYLGKKPLN